jgi:hypothetical protein
MRIAAQHASPVLAFQSELPTAVFQPQLPQPYPAPTLSPYYLSTDRGGVMYCGQQQGSVLLTVPPGFVAGAGADVRCELTYQLSQRISAPDIADDQGVLIGIYPAPSSLLTPLMLTFEVDRARAGRMCPTCWSVRVYDAVTHSWNKLPTIYEDSTARVKATISQVLPASQYPGYTDRGLVALFGEVVTPTPLPVPSSTPNMAAATIAQASTPHSTMLSPTGQATAAPITQPTKTMTAATQPSTSSADTGSWGLLIAVLIGALIGAGGAILIMRRRT